MSKQSSYSFRDMFLAASGGNYVHVRYINSLDGAGAGTLAFDALKHCLGEDFPINTKICLRSK